MREDPSFRDVGFVPGYGTSARARVRSEMSGGNVFGQYLMSFLMLGGCGGAFAALGVLCLILGIRGWGTRDALFVGGFPFFLVGAVAFIWISVKVMARSNRWVELDGEVIRAKNLYTGRVTERSVWELEEITTEVFLIASTAVHITEAIQGRVRGFAFKFRDLPQPVRVYRPEMQNVSELIEATVAKLSERGTVVPEFVDFEGRPMVRRLIWEGTPPGVAGGERWMPHN